MHALPLFHRLYGDDLSRLPAPIVTIHDVRDIRTWHGEATVAQGTSFAARLLCRLLRFPPSGGDVPLVVVMERDGAGKIWRRRFADRPMTTRLVPGLLPGTVAETLSPVTLVSRLDVDAGDVMQVPVAVRLLGLPLPQFLWPEIIARETTEGALYRFMIAIDLPWGAPLVRYEGWLDSRDRPDQS
jgi:hypothetical protein